MGKIYAGRRTKPSCAYSSTGFFVATPCGGPAALTKSESMLMEPMKREAFPSASSLREK